jgi:3'-5' exoribonuclease
MSKAKKLPLVPLHELQTHQFADFFALLSDKSRGSTRDGKPFYTCKFRDHRRTVSAVPIWADNPHFDDCQAHWQPGQFFKVRGTFTEHEKYGPQVEIDQIRPVEDRDRADGFTELLFVERSRFDPDQMFAELDAAVVGEISDPPLRNLVLKLLHTHADALKRLPASERHAYPFAGGWLEHILSVVHNCIFLADRYAKKFPDLKPPLNRDLIIAGAVLHDIGRVKDLEFSTPGQPARHGVAGELFSYVYLGYDLIRSAAKEIPDLDPERLDLLLHIVVTHLRQPEWNSLKNPCIPESLIVHHADELDSKFEVYARCLTRDTSEGPFTDRDPALGRVLLKSRKV